MNKYLVDGLRNSGLDPESVNSLKQEKFLSEMLRWNQRINLTAITEQTEATEKHIVDSLLLLPFLGASRSLLDMGSGAGLPGIPLQLARPELEVVSVDSVGKKINFQRHIKRLLELDNFLPLQVRLENLSEKLPQGKRFDLITARAFSSLETIVTMATPWLSPGGKILAMKGPEGKAEVSAVNKIITAAGLVVESIHEYQLPYSGADRQVIVLAA